MLNEKEAQSQLFAMDTYMSFRAWGSNADRALQEVCTLVRSLDERLSATAEGSDIYAVNHAAGGQVNLSPESVGALSAALALSDALGTTLELTIYPISLAWGFTTEDYRIPEPSELSSLLPLVDDSRIELDAESGTVRLPAEAALDMGAVAKGYAGDLAADLLETQGIHSALLNLGGSTIRTLGTKPDGSPWRIAIRDPENPDGLAGVVETVGGAVNTSGGYERWFEGSDGEVYWHILDPETGYPAKKGLSSVTIVSDTALLGDGLSTALFVMGLNEAIDYWRAQGGFEFILIDEEGSLYVSEGAAENFQPMGDYLDANLTIVTRETGN